MNCSKLGANGLRCELTWIRNDRNPHEAHACLLFVTLHGISGNKVNARTRHARTLKQKN